MEEIVPGIWYHFKHPEQQYRVIGVAMHTETEEPMVVYQALYGDNQLYVRPAAMFLEHVDKPDFGYTGPRFVYVGSE